MTTKVPAELSSTPSIVDNGNATAITIDSSENVTVNNGTLTSSGANGADNQGFHITDTGYSKTHKLFGDNSLHIQADSGQSILMKPNASEKARFTSDGLTFNGDTAAANALDDYEEGEHNPTITAGSGTPSIASVEDTLSYTKIGNKVFINGQLGGCNASGCSGTLSLTMPFACAAQSERADFYFGTASTNNNDVVMFVLTNTANTNVFTIAVVEQDGTKNTSSAAFMSTKSPFDMNFTGFHYTTT
tara:strand:+ start:1872 stop:2609 length:738 start_codon:yes stop_codon:yes gene_type:complete